jgi:hypothetical protein|nr:MAG TPA: hypothetical protein [Bacteriophage sp.]
MIKTDKGQIEIEGNIASVIADVGVISNTVRDTLVENGMSKEMAEEWIIDIVKKGFMSDEEIAKVIEEKNASILGGASKK